MAEFVGISRVVDLIPNGASIMVGGFMGCGSPHKLLRAIAQKGVSDLTVICNDAGMPNGPDGSDYYGVAKLIHNRQVKKLIATHVGLNPEVAIQLNEGFLDLTCLPQGSMVEMIRAGGAGLGGILTPTGLGTIVEDAWHVHSVVEVENRKYLLEKPLKAHFALISGYKIDKAANIWYKGTTRNFNAVMATAADVVMAQAENLVNVGEIKPEDVVTPGVFVDYVVTGGERDG